jgi:hypothetical protein
MQFMPPRHGKSALTTVRYPIYRMERNSGIRVMPGCYDQSLANLFSRQSRRIAQDRGFRGGEIRAQDEWETIGGGSFRAVGVGGGITGRGADLIIIDDPIRSREEANSERWRDRIFDWYTNDISTRLEQGGAIILSQTRWHEDDLASRILASPDGPNWTVIQLPAEAEADDPLGREEGAALCPERFDLPALYDIKSVMGLDYYALYEQRLMAQEGGLYKKAWFRYATAEELAELAFDYILQAWDTASSQLGDWSACVTAGVAGNEVVVLDVFRARLETPDLLRAVKDQAAKWGPRMILVEDAASGIAIQQMLRRETRLPVVPIQALLNQVNSDLLLPLVAQLLIRSDSPATVQAVFEAETILNQQFPGKGPQYGLGKALLGAFLAAPSVEVKNRLAGWIKHTAGTSVLRDLAQLGQPTHEDIDILTAAFGKSRYLDKFRAS